MVNKYLKFNIRNNTNAAGLLAQGVELVNADDIESVAYAVGTGILTLTLKGSVGVSGATTAVSGLDRAAYTLAGGGDGDVAIQNAISGGVGAAGNVQSRVISILCSTSVSAAAIPTITLGGSSPRSAVFAAMTANPGGIQSTVQLGLDDAATPIQMYFRSLTVVTAVIA